MELTKSLKILGLILILGLSVNCFNSYNSYSQVQYKESKLLIPCIKEIAINIRQEIKIEEEIIQLRNKYGYSKFINTSMNYDLIKPDVLLPILNKYRLNCIDSVKYFKGLRYIGNYEMIFEINEFKTSRLSNEYSNRSLYEMHRILVNKSENISTLNLEEISFKDEIIIKKEDIEPGVTYIISHHERTF